MTWTKQSVSSGTTTVTPTKLILGGSVKFTLNFTAKTLAYTSYELYALDRVITLTTGSVTLSTLGNSQFQYVCFNTSSSVFELVSYLNIATYTGYILFAVYNSTLYPLSYPIGQIGVVGGILNRQHQTAIKEWTIIGDSLSQGQGWWTYVQDEIWIPTITNLAVSGMRMAMSSGMWTEKDTVTATTDLCTIMGGTNDEATCYNTDGTSTSVLGSLQPIKGTFDTNTFYGAYQTLIEGLLTKNPNMRIILMTPPRAWKDSTASVLRKNLANIGNDVKAIGAAYNLPVVDMYNQMGYNEVNQSTFLSDGLHFVATGYQRVASLVCNAMRQYSYE